MSPGEWERRIRAAEARLVKVRPVRIVCEFRRKPAGDSDLKPATIPI
jgi:hypothetical protein